MGLFLVAVPIGNDKDITLRALECLKESETIIVEERKIGSKILRAHGIAGKPLFELNEHSTGEEIQELAQMCANQKVALITDAGTPGFSDPGSELVRRLRQKNIPVTSLPGASSLMTLLSLSSQKLTEFVFRGFLSAENTLREKQWRELTKEKRPIIVMDTPYRLSKTLQELELHFPTRKILLAADMTAENELILEGTAREIAARLDRKKAEFMALIY